MVCDCHNSSFVNPYHKHVITGDMNFVQDGDLRKLLNKGLGFRLPETRNSTKAFNSIKAGIQDYIAYLSKKFKVAEIIFNEWRNDILNKVKHKLGNISTNLNSNVSFIDTKKAFDNLDKLHDKFVFVPTDKSANNISIVCKKFYLSCIQAELDASFTFVNESPEDIIAKQKVDLSRFGITLDGDCDNLSSFYATCKQHKSPVKFRYITSTTCAVTKPLARIMKGCFSAIQKEVIRFCNLRDYQRKDKAKTCWIIDNNVNVRKQIFKCNRSISIAESICSYDFDTLYTTLPHNKLKFVIDKIIDESFESSGKSYIRVTSKCNANFSDSDRKYKGTYILNKDKIKQLFNYMIDNCYIVFKGKVYRQNIGVPMGIDPAPFIANLFLHFYENRYVYSLINSGNLYNAKKLANNFRYLDDLLGLNDKGFFSQVN